MKLVIFAASMIVLNAAPAAAQVARTCGQGAALRVSAAQARQGDLLTIELRSTKPLGAVDAKWAGQEIPLWSAEAGGGKAADARRGLIGVDLEKVAGKYELKISAHAKNGGGEVSCAATIVVRPGWFATERLTLPKKFVEPDAEATARANQERDKLRAIFSTVTEEHLWTGNFRIPVDGAATGSNFGRRRILNGEPGSPHGGADFPAATGTPIYAAQRGRVVLAEELYFSGNTVVIDHGLGVYTLYGHLSEITVKVGDEVEKSAAIGKAGATGRVTGPHLHWGLTVDRARVNPMEIVNRADL